ncbi:MFS transporter [Luteibacter rhizovicinus DSM 16549]|uniref:MFS transporter n=1 Tax=Luteibacter rhizovicinus DSM 16549 TaxID=1440763 RepID=A0A1L3ETJ9_9GAMM|nr:MFS transporter [Luteibacter rhizovicinus]APG04352.1 MFS transporter [Luteibacter rhizovicinus DSM 16549]KLD73591.1 arabinose transporter permease [Xanthomonas hyacinthi DSM 19077]
MNPSPSRLPLLALAVAAFAIGTTEFVIMGLLPEVATDLKVSIPSAGMLVSGYALGVALGAPLLAALTAKMERKHALLLLMGLFILGNALCAIAPNYDVLMVARVVAAFCHGSFFGIGAVVAAHLVPANQRARAIALMFAGLTLANVLGVPFGTFLGQWAGWRSTFWAVTALGVIAALGVVRFVPSLPDLKAPDMRRELRVLREPQALIALGMTVLGFGGVFTVFTYIAPILQEQSHVSPHWTGAVLVLFGLGTTIGNILGGRLADWKLMPSLMGILVVLTASLVAFAWTMHSTVASVVTVFLWGIAAFATIAPLQSRVVHVAGDAPNLASTLNIAAFNLGNAGGAWLGGAVLAAGYSMPTVSLTGAAVTVAGLLATMASVALERRRPMTAVAEGA